MIDILRRRGDYLIYEDGLDRIRLRTSKNPDLEEAFGLHLVFGNANIEGFYQFIYYLFIKYINPRKASRARMPTNMERDKKRKL